MSRTMAVHVRYSSWYISTPSCAKQKRENTEFDRLNSTTSTSTEISIVSYEPERLI